ncbi:MAG: DUF2399 domain-containing protein [Candidatus Fermentithermobacillus carboniphilus]|uniref:DUF2399 domain-containing protein n=1 Tax=Candidatus Fermentithermobacillus carboniphilus TaxID=3085328 RepID=A0AAT9LE24_9FIRM|nr:MAG: DUF2399 domain-containing protein [Candidatus Fermentithermobacillus carboniphilus]
MKDYRKLILDKLLEKYERSKLYAIQKREGGLVGGGRNVILRYSRKEFPDYWDESTAEKRQAINLATSALETEGIIRVRRARWDRDTVERVYLCLERLDDAYEIAGRYPRERKEASMEKVVAKWLRRWQTELEDENAPTAPERHPKGLPSTAEEGLENEGAQTSPQPGAGGLPAIAEEELECEEAHTAPEPGPAFPRCQMEIENQGLCLRAGVAFLRELETRLKDCLSLPCGFSLDDAGLLEDVCKSIDSLSRLTSEMPARVFSVRVFGDSKRFEQLRVRVTDVLSEFGVLDEVGLSKEDFDSQSEFKDALLEELGIVSNPVHVFVSGPLKLARNGQVVDLGDFVPDVGLPDKMVRDFEIVSIGTDTVLTVENLTSFHMLAQTLCESHRERCLLVYLGGYHNKTRREFLRKIYRKFMMDGRVPRFFHWGDIDLGGFRIYQHLVSRTGIPIRPLLMDKDTYQAYSAQGKQICPTYRKSLEILLDNPKYQVFHEVIRAIVDRGVVVEQESIDIPGVLSRFLAGPGYR